MMQFGNSTAKPYDFSSAVRWGGQRAEEDPWDWLLLLRSALDESALELSVSCRAAEALVGICADCPLVIVPALPPSLGVETPLLPARWDVLLRAESVSEVCDGPEPAAVVLPAKLGADGTTSRAAVAKAVDSLGIGDHAGGTGQR